MSDRSWFLDDPGSNRSVQFELQVERSIKNEDIEEMSEITVDARDHLKKLISDKAKIEQMLTQTNSQSEGRQSSSAVVASIKRDQRTRSQLKKTQMPSSRSKAPLTYDMFWKRFEAVSATKGQVLQVLHQPADTSLLPNPPTAITGKKRLDSLLRNELELSSAENVERISLSFQGKPLLKPPSLDSHRDQRQRTNRVVEMCSSAGIENESREDLPELVKPAQPITLRKRLKLHRKQQIKVSSLRTTA
jgi:hypothetical protein